MENGPDDPIYSGKTSTFEIALIVLILLISIASIFWIRRAGGQATSESKTALLYHQNKLLEEVHLNRDGLFTSPVKGMQVEVKDGKIRVASSDCPKQICINTGWIKTPRQVVVCVPNKVLVEIKSVDSPLLDAVVY